MKIKINDIFLYIGLFILYSAIIGMSFFVTGFVSLNKEIFLIIIALMLALIIKTESISKLLVSILIFACISSIVRQDNIIMTCLYSVSIGIFSCLKKDYFKKHIIVSFIAFLPFGIGYMVRFIKTGGDFLGNRWPIFICVITIMIIAYLYQKRTVVLPLIIIQIVFVGILAILGSRTAMITMLMSCAITVFWYYRKKTTLAKFLLFIIAMIAMVIFFVDQLNNILQVIFMKWEINQFSSQSFFQFSGRTLMWEDVLKNFKFWGLGEEYTLLKFNVLNIHNSYMQAFVSHGLLTAIFYIFWHLNSIKLIRKNIDSYEVQGYAIFLIPMFIFSLLESTYIMDPGYPFLGLCIAVFQGQLYSFESIKNKDELNVQS